MILKKSVIVLIMSLWMIMAGLSSSSIAIDNDALIELLIKKGIITREEVDLLIAEEAEKTKQSLPLKKDLTDQTIDAKSKNPDLSGLKIRGHILTRFTDEENQDSSFSIPEARVRLSGELSDKIEYTLQADLSDGRRPLLDAYLDLKYIEYVQIRIGQFNVPFGVEGPEGATRLPTIVRSRVTRELFQGRDIGVQLSGGYDFENIGLNVQYALALINGAGRNRLDDNNNKEIVGRISIEPVEGVTIGFSGHVGEMPDDNSTENIDKERYGLDIEYLRRGLKLRSEYIAGQNGDIHLNGWYVLAAYKFMEDKIEPLIRFDQFDSDQVTGQINTLTLGLNYYFIENTRAMFNYEFRNAESPDEDNNRLLAQLQVVF